MPAILKALSRNLVVILVAGGSLSCAWFAYQTALHWETRQLQAAIRQETAILTGEVGDRLKMIVDEVHTLGGVFVLGRAGTQADFAELTRRILEHHAMLHGLAWAPRSVGPDGTQRFPLAHVSLSAPQSLPLGYDMASEPLRAAAIELAVASGAAALTGRLTLQPAQAPGVVLIQPVFRSERLPPGGAVRREALLGILAVGIDSRRFFDHVAQPVRERFDFVVRDGGSTGEVLHVHANRPAAGAIDLATIENAPLAHEAQVPVDGRVWTIRYAPTPVFLAAYANNRALLVLLLSLLLATAITAVAWLTHRRREKLKELVAEKTAALGESEERFRLATEAIQEGIWDRDLSDDSYFLSPAFGEILGVELGARRPSPFIRDRVHPDDSARWDAAHYAHLEHGAPFDIEIRLRHENGRYRWVRSRGRVIHAADGRPVRMIGAISDITAEREAAAERTRMLARMHALVQDTPLVAVIGFDRDHNVSLWNHAAETFFGFTTHQALGRRIGDLLSERHESDKLKEMLERVWGTGLPYGPREAYFTLADRRRRWMQACIFPLLDEDRRVVEVYGMGVDITDRVEAAHALQVSETRFRDLSELSADWFWEMDADLRFSYFSGGSDSRMSQYLGKHRWDLPIDLTPEEWAAHKAILQGRQPFRNFEYRVHHVGDVLRWYSISGIPLFEGGHFVGYRGTGREITLRKSMEEELRQHRDHLEEQVRTQTADLLVAKEAAERAVQAKSEFLANMSHELRTPMHAILSFARIGHAKAETVSSDKLREYFEHIHASGERLLELVNDLLDLSKLEAGRMRYTMGAVDLRQLAEEVAAGLGPLFKAKLIICRIEADAPASHVQGDRKRLAQVLQNLLGNAFKFAPPESCVQIEIAPAILPVGRRRDDAGTLPAWRLTVLDAGIGVPEDELDSIFDKFVQSSKTDNGSGGTGLGLAICREIVKAHRGQICARNRQEGGAAFEILLPAVGEDMT